MNPLESPWFFRMVEDASARPVDRLLAVFKVTQNWIAAPGIRDSLSQSFASHGYGMHNLLQLREFIARLATSAGAEKPDVLANHLIILLQGAIAEELRNPELHAMAEAANAARAVIEQSRPHLRRRRLALLSLGGIAASLLAGFVSWHLLMQAPRTAPANTVIIASSKAILVPTGVSPSDMEAVLNLHEQFTRGVCQSPQLLMLPPGQMTAYTNAINFRTPDDPAADRENLRALMAWFRKTQSADCYYAPKNGHTTASWTKG